MDYCGLKNGLPFMFLVDDDHFVVVRNLVAELHVRSPNDEIYMGHAQNGPEPIRDPLDKNFVGYILHICTNHKASAISVTFR